MTDNFKTVLQIQEPNIIKSNNKKSTTVSP